MAVVQSLHGHINGGAVACALLVTVALLYIRRFIVQYQFARKHGCQPIAHSFSKDPFLGLDVLPKTLRALRDHKILEIGWQNYHIYGNTYRLRELHRNIILTIEPENIKTILSLKFNDYGIGHRLEPFKPLLGQGIFNTDGDHWAASRAIIRPSFNRDQVADLAAFERLFQDFLPLLPRDGVTEVDLQPLFFCYTIDSATEFLFGRSAGTLKTSGSEHEFAQAFHRAQQAIVTRGTLGPLNYVYKDSVAEKCNRICRDFAQQYVDEAFRAVNGVEKAHNFGDEASKYVFAHELASRTSDRTRVLDELMNIMVAGRDTTASLLSNMFFMLAKNPDIWEKLRREVSSLEGRPPTYEELRNLEYVQWCMNESLRLHPVVPRNDRQAVRDTILPCGGGKDSLSPVFVPKGTLVSYNVYAMHRRTDIYGPDVEEFRPERWKDAHLRPKWGYLPFNAGPRICIGQRYALTEVGYVLVRMVQSFEKLESRDPGPWEESLALTLCSRNGARVSLRPAGTAH